MVDRAEMRKTQDMIAITSEQATRLKEIAKRWKHESVTDTLELLLNAYDKASFPDADKIPDDPNHPV